MEIDDWLLRFARREIPLSEALGIYLQESNAPSLLRQMYEHAIDRYMVGEVKDLAEAFGIAMSMDERRDENDMRRNPEKWAGFIRGLVEQAHDDGYPLSKPGATKTTTAFHRVANMAGMRTSRGVQMSPMTIWEIYTRGEDKAAKTRAANKRKKVE